MTHPRVNHTGKKMTQRRKRGSSKFRRRMDGSTRKGVMKGNYSYEPKGKQ
jgi:hypothetical protein